MKTIVRILTVTLVAALMACSPSRRPETPISNRNVGLALEQSHTLIKAGESVTFTAHASGTAGRQEQIRWEAKGGDVERVNDMDRYARVEYPYAGTYAVVASLYVDGRLVDQERAVVQVEPLS